MSENARFRWYHVVLSVLIVLLFAALVVMDVGAQGQPAQEGYLSRYDLHPTKYTLAARLDFGHITRAQVDAAKVLVAVSDCGRIGETGTITINGAGPMPYLVFDCAGADAVDWMRDNNIVAELGYHSATAFWARVRGGE